MDLLSLFHVNDIYNAEKSSRFVHQWKKAYQEQDDNGRHCLAFFGGDAWSPSIMTTIVRGKQMVPVLNVSFRNNHESKLEQPTHLWKLAVKIPDTFLLWLLVCLEKRQALKLDAACLGNHDLDLGLVEFAILRDQCTFPWVCSNVRHKDSSLPLGGCKEYVVLESKNETGPKAKLLALGLVEGDWIDTLSTIEPEAIVYEDFVTYVKRRVPEVSSNVCFVFLCYT